MATFNSDWAQMVYVRKLTSNKEEGKFVHHDIHFLSVITADLLAGFYDISQNIFWNLLSLVHIINAIFNTLFSYFSYSFHRFNNPFLLCSSFWGKQRLQNRKVYNSSTVILACDIVVPV